MLESKYQADLIRRIARMFPESIVLKNDPNYMQGILDITIFVGPRYAMLEVKASEKSRERPNQRHYVERINRMGGFAAFIYPENEEEVLHALQQSLAG